MAGEHVILLDEQDQPAGMLEKYAAHTFDTPLHLAFSCWLFNQQGQLLVTRRSLGKSLARGMDQLGLRTPQQGETFEQAVTRRCRFELGVEISDIAPVHPAFRYRAVAPNGIVENEVCPVYAARVVSEVQPNDDEVMDYQWVDRNHVKRAGRHAVGVQPVDGAGSGKSGRPPGADRLCCASARVS